MKIKFVRNVFFKGESFAEGDTQEVKEDDRDVRFMVAIGKAVVVKDIETASVTPEEQEAMASPENEAGVSVETASLKAAKPRKGK